eukprot:CAMPEP_0174956956 /NCGR_PEP_ID=MMETSP0004_2-20121128/1813_1 /TAXON_ID=420556 /ORGANISM="Ochromonas sp., Strain CCMP1393" /LENGTH=64 /DNA_ID=CAMNT_0016205029 /DNA_START=146 /DNA_END=340 /DNA_ORIENTATION=-
MSDWRRSLLHTSSAASSSAGVATLTRIEAERVGADVGADAGPNIDVGPDDGIAAEPLLTSALLL